MLGITVGLGHSSDFRPCCSTHLYTPWSLATARPNWKGKSVVLRDLNSSYSSAVIRCSKMRYKAASEANGFVLLTAGRTGSEPGSQSWKREAEAHTFSCKQETQGAESKPRKKLGPELSTFSIFPQ